MRKVEIFAAEEELLRRIEQLKADGVMENAMTVVADKELAGDSLNYTEVNFKAADGSGWDKIASWFSEGEPEDRVMSELELDAEEEATDRSAFDRGDFLLYVNNRTADTATYAGNDGSIEKDEYGAVAPGERDQFVPGSDRENALGEREGAYDIDEKVTDDNYGLTEDE